MKYCVFCCSIHCSFIKRFKYVRFLIDGSSTLLTKQIGTKHLHFLYLMVFVHSLHEHRSHKDELTRLHLNKNLFVGMILFFTFY